MEASQTIYAIQDGREIEKDQNGMGISEEGVAYTLDSTGAQSICSAEASRSCAKTSASPDVGQDSPASDPACSSSSPESQMSLFAQADGSSLRTFPDFFPATTAEISRSYSRRWPSSGFTTSPGECWTADTSECPSGGDASSSLADVLLETVPERFFLSPRAAAGILRRAEKRGRELPKALQSALSSLAARADEATASTLREPQEQRASTPARTEPDEERPSFLSENQRAEVLETPYARQLTTGGGKPGQGYPAARIGSTVRRLTPTECERLQGFPDGHTIPSPTVRATPLAATPSPSPSPNGSAGGF